MLELKNVTAVAVDCVDTTRAIKALDISSKYCNFAETKLLTSKECTSKSHTIEEIEHIGSIYEYNRFMIEEFTDYFDTEFVLVIHHDGFVLNPKAWNNDFLKYDYIGAPWKPGPYHKVHTVGNGGFSLRSKTICDFTAEIGYHNAEHEDVYICKHLKPLYKDVGIKIAPLSLAYSFSKEHGKWNGEFGFHNFKTDISSWKDKDILGD